MSNIDSHSRDIRESYLEYFGHCGCLRRPSSSLIPDDDGLMFTNSGMYQFKQYFTRDKTLDEKSIGFTTSQRCFRSNDLDIIGGDGRHLSFFEMLGNFSFGKMSRQEMCERGLDFSCQVLGLDKSRIYVSVLDGDDETSGIWREIGIDDDHIVKMDEEDNFWSVSETGPCGPCTEMYYDRGEGCGCGDDDCRPGCTCDRFLEYWNIVFTSFNRLPNGELVNLPNGGNIDTGMGLERVVSLVGGYNSVFECDLLLPLVEGICMQTKAPDEKVVRMLSDHLRSITMLISEGVLPSNNNRGYVLRKLIRRTILGCRESGMEICDLFSLLDVLDESYRGIYDLGPHIHRVEDVMSSESRKFSKTLDKGEKLLRNKVKTEGIVRGDTIFTLHDTYGLPKDVSLELCQQMQVPVCDLELFDLQMTRQKSHGGKTNSW